MSGGYANGGRGGSSGGGVSVSFGPTREQFDALFEEVSKLKLQFSTLQDQRRSVGDEWVTAYACIDPGDKKPLLLNAEDALRFVRKQIYETTRAPYPQRWERDPADGEWIFMSEDWEVSDTE